MASIKRELYFLLASLGVEMVAVGVGVLISSVSGWVIGGIGLCVFLFFLWKAVRIKVSELSSVEMQREIKLRKKYLPQIKVLIADITNRIEILSQDSTLYDLDEYRNEYPIKGWHFKRMMRVDDNTSLEGYLWVKKVFADNLVFKRIQDDDGILSGLTLQLDNYYTEVHDKKVKRFIKNIRKALHIAYSYVVFNRLSTKYFKSIPMKTKLEYEHSRKMMDRVRDLQSGLNIRIKELLEGAQDEL